MLKALPVWGWGRNRMWSATPPTPADSLDPAGPTPGKLNPLGLHSLEV